MAGETAATPIISPAKPGTSVMSDSGRADKENVEKKDGSDKARMLLKKMNHVLKTVGKSDESLQQVRKVVPQFVKSLISFMTSNDIQVVADAAALLARCAQHYPEVVKQEDLTVVRAKHADLNFAPPSTSTVDSPAKLKRNQVHLRLKAVLADILRAVDAPQIENPPPCTGGLSELVIYVRRDNKDAVSPERNSDSRATLQPLFGELKRRIVNIHGVVSATVQERREGSFLILLCQPHQIAFAAGNGMSFADRLGALAEQLGFTAQLVNKTGADQYSSTAASETPSAYAEDITDAAIAQRFTSMAGGNKWSFFNTSNCYLPSKHQVVEYDEDPDLCARLARIKERDAKKKEEERAQQSSVTRFLGSLVGRGDVRSP
jgi:hypothetical protein